MTDREAELLRGLGAHISEVTALLGPDCTATGAIEWTQGMVIAEAVRRHYQEIVLWAEWLRIYEDKGSHTMTLIPPEPAGARFWTAADRKTLRAIAEQRIANHRRAMAALWEGYESCMI